ncbi:MAG: hypothetical protein ACOYXA_14710 [Bacteroidota bacterium]|jgi:hypothetical protein
MNEITHPILSKKTILKAAVIAFAAALLIVLIAVLPAEYGIDPTGAGKLMGFSKLYQPEKSVVAEAAPVKVKVLKLEDAGSGPEVPKPAEANNPPPAQQYEEREDTVNITIPAGKGLEYKVYLLKYGKMKYEWGTDDGTAFFDFHGEVHEENPSKNVFYESYTVAYSNNMIGTFLAPFEGKHGWYFKNSGTTDMNVKLRMRGEYRLLSQN